MTILQTAVAGTKATIGKILVLNPKFQVDDNDKYKEREIYGRYLLETDRTKATDSETKAAKDDIKPDVLLDGAVLELKTVATAKKAESKISYYNIPAQNPAVEYRTDFTVEYEPDKKGEKIATVEFKNISDRKLQIAIVDSSYDITRVKFTTIDKSATKKYTANAAKSGKVLLVRTASIAANAKNGISMELGGKEAVYPIIHPGKAGALSNYKFTPKADTEGASILSIPTPASGKKYAYEKVNEKVEELKLCATVPASAREIDEKNGTLSTELTSLEVGKFVVVYEYNESNNLVTAFVCYELKTNDIGTSAPQTVVIIANGSVPDLVAGDGKISGLTSNQKYIVAIGDTYYPVTAEGKLGSAATNKAEATNAAELLTGTEITGLMNGTTYLVENVTT